MVPPEAEVSFIDVQLAFIKHVCEFNQFIALNLPTPIQIKAVATLLTDFKYLSSSQPMVFEYSSYRTSNQRGTLPQWGVDGTGRCLYQL